MAVQPLQVSNTAILNLTSSAGFRWDDSGQDIAGVLLGDAYTPDASHTAYSSLTNEISDSDYEQQPVENRSISNPAGNRAVFTSDAVDFGGSVTISARYLALVAGEAGSLAPGDAVIGVIDLNDEGGEISSVGGNFQVSPDPTTGWFFIEQT